MLDAGLRASPARCLAAVVTALLLLALAGCERYALDRQMEELCKKDGGVKVYERVALPPEMFGPDGYPFPGWRSRPESQRLGAGYRLVEETVYLKQGDPLKGEGRLTRYHWKLLRTVDGKLLGEGVLYGRSGGDLIVVDHFSSKVCPSQFGEAGTVIKSVFYKGSN